MEYARCGGSWTCFNSRKTSVAVSARQSIHQQEWRIDGPAPGGRGRDQGRGEAARGRGGRGAARGRGSRPPTPRVPNRLFDDDQGDHSGPNSRPTRIMAPRRPPPDRSAQPTSLPLSSQRAPRLSPPSRDTQDPFTNLHSWIQIQHADGVVVRRETWEKLLDHIRTSGHAREALDLMLRDAEVRDATGWEWATHGYGQTAFQLVQVASIQMAAVVGAPELAGQVLERREDLHLTLNKDFVPSLMRKVAAATATSESADGIGLDNGNIDARIEVIQQLYEQEAALRGANSPEAAYELSRVLRRAGDVRGVSSLHLQIREEALAVRDGLLEDMERWLAKR
ncbi:hypothetical protein VaNZ11_011433, partial [Volvox africanus]